MSHTLAAPRPLGAVRSRGVAVSKKRGHGPVAVLNASYEAHQYVDFPQAMRMLMRGIALVEEALVDAHGNPRMVGEHPWPRVVRLIRYVSTAWQHRPAAWSRAALIPRDQGRCCYCGGKATTIDHIKPRSKGGEWSWLNCVAACPDCNERKGDRTPAEAGMRMRYQPWVPTRAQVKALLATR